MALLTASVDGAADVARAICRRIGADPAGPIGRRLGDRCAQLPPDALAALGTTVAAAGDADPGGLFRRLVDEATNRETYFFRDRNQLALLIELLAERGAAAPRLWSAGCATGEEAYSVAILLSRTPALDGATVLGTDLSNAALAAAAEAVYRTGPMSACRAVAAEDEAFLPQAGERQRRVADAVRERVRFRAHNLPDGPPDGAPFDAILCRNVLVYMDHDGRRRSLAAIDAALKPGGVLLIGPGDASAPHDPASLGYRPLYRKNALAFLKDPADAR